MYEALFISAVYHHLHMLLNICAKCMTSFEPPSFHSFVIVSCIVDEFCMITLCIIVLYINFLINLLDLGFNQKAK